MTLLLVTIAVVGVVVVVTGRVVGVVDGLEDELVLTIGVDEEEVIELLVEVAVTAVAGATTSSDRSQNICPVMAWV